MEIPNFKKSDFMNGMKPYEFVYQFHNSPFEHERAIQLVSDEAKQQGIYNFKKMYFCYLKSIERTQNSFKKPYILRYWQSGTYAKFSLISLIFSLCALAATFIR